MISPPRAQPTAAASPDAEPLGRDVTYMLGPYGFLHATARDMNRATARPSAVLLFSVNHENFELGLPDGQTLKASAMAIAPQVLRTLKTEGCQLLSLNLLPAHRQHPAFRAIAQPGGLVLARQAFVHLDDAFEHLFQGQASLDEARSASREWVNIACAQLPQVPPPDPRALEVIRLLDQDPSLHASQLAEHLGRSASWLSRMFSNSIGLSLREYQAWVRQRNLYDLLYTQHSLTEVALAAGFSDSPQFSRTYQRWYGTSPSFSRNPKYVQAVAATPNTKKS